LDTVIAADKKELISRVVSIIKHKLETVQAVIYLGKVPDEFGTIFFLILTANDEQRQAQALSAMIEESCQPVAKIVALVHHQSFVTGDGKSANLFVRRALNCPVVYLSGDMLLPVHHSNRPVGFDSVGPLWDRWHRQGKDFLEGAAYYLQKGAVNAALFSLHQCAECLLLAVIRAVSGYRINNHNLLSLLRINQMFTGDLVAVFNLDDTEEKELFELLKYAYIQVRYRDNFEAGSAPVKTLLEKVRLLEQRAENIYQAHLSGSCL